MATIHVRYLVQRPGPAGGLPRWFWQPKTALQKQSWQARRVPADWARHHDAAALEAAAIGAAQALNAVLDAARAAAAAAPAPAVVRPPPAARTLADLVALYEGSKAFGKLKPKTQKGYRQCLGILKAKGGDAPVRAIDAPYVQGLHAEMAATPAYANAVIRVLSLLLEFGCRSGWITVNPALRAGLAGAEPSGILWPRAAVLAFVQAADAMERHSIGTAVLLNEWLGQREADILRMPAVALRGEGAERRLIARQGKTGAGVSLPVGMVPHLVQRLAEELERVRRYKPTPTTIIVSEATRKPYREDHFHHEFARVRAYAADVWPSFEIDHLMPGRDTTDPGAFQIDMLALTFMRLRHTAITRLAEAGCDAGLIASVSGHSLSTVTAIMSRYMVRTSEQAVLAFRKRLDKESGR